MKVVDGYFASGRYVNTVETVNAAYCKIDVGEETTMLAKGGNINLHLHRLYYPAFSAPDIAMSGGMSLNLGVNPRKLQAG